MVAASLVAYYAIGLIIATAAKIETWKLSKSIAESMSSDSETGKMTPPGYEATDAPDSQTTTTPKSETESTTLTTPTPPNQEVTKTSFPIPARKESNTMEQNQDKARTRLKSKTVGNPKDMIKTSEDAGFNSRKVKKSDDVLILDPSGKIVAKVPNKKKEARGHAMKNVQQQMKRAVEALEKAEAEAEKDTK